MKYYCENCGSEIVLQDDVWLGDNKKLCPLCWGGTDLQELPVYETVKQWEARTGRKYPDSAPVYLVPKNLPANRRESGIHLQRYGALQKSGLYFIVVATEAGAPPVDWRPE